MTGNRLATYFLSAWIMFPMTAQADFAAATQAYDGGDYETAFAQWHALARAGDARAQIAVAGMHRFGEGRPVDLAAAARWYRRAARSGEAVAQLNLGEMYMLGTGVPRDFVRAYMWLTLAVDRGKVWAAERRDELARRMRGAERARAGALVRDWRPGQ